ncbi:MAG: cell division protein ZapE [Lysobacterales bacterium CG17_big_fil_post_rev_8_21_14_2_50_64_11]|nr:MAG: cell division protein ZapE [Xanthomonadales bacterium CG17_big_fil_post_rev_8_21_14_2_50_64_11]PIX61628.1 MAG: cell division protein ZapE [Xanthomonadales bacterium CG_4_10_14_3_um_filter_64_11]
MNATPSHRYAAGVAAGRWLADPMQQAVLPLLDGMVAALRKQRLRARWMARWLARTAPVPVRGLYLWGAVGRGKTFLADLVFESAAGVRKRRQHFHHFMAEVHTRLNHLPEQPDPLARVAADIADAARLLVLDEFVVSDIGDAMILSRLLEHLFARGVTLVTTANSAPKNLYRDGLQRARFAPAIALIERHCHVHELVSVADYRLRQLTQAPVYLSPLDANAEHTLHSCFAMLSANTAREARPLTVAGRALPVRAMAKGVVWFEFAVLCDGPRAVADYIEIARSFHTVLLANVPQFDSRHDDAACRFVHLIDEFYDRHVNLILSAAAGPLQLYRGERLAAAFERTSSRLIEMQSADYLAREHRG